MKLKALIITVLVSFGLLAALLFLIWWNEQTGFKLKRQKKNIYDTTVSVDINDINSSNDGRLVYLNGDLSFDEAGAGDYLFDVYVKSPRVDRIVEKYQYKETIYTDEDGNEEVSYDKVWSSSYINSKNFKDSTKSNPTESDYSSATFFAEDIRIGKYKLSESLMNQIETSVEYTDLDPLVADAYDLKINGKYFTNSVDPNNPEIGDIRISFVYSPTDRGTILSMQSYDSFIIYTYTNGVTYNKFVGRIVNKSAIINMINMDDNLLRWELRLALIVVLFFLLLITFRPVTKFTERIKFFGKIDFAYLIILCILFSILIYSLEAALVWLIYNPLISLVLVLVAAAAGALIFVTGKHNEVSTRETQMFNYSPEVVGEIEGVNGMNKDAEQEKILESILGGDNTNNE